jgi:hypothetical protein
MDIRPEPVQVIDADCRIWRTTPGPPAMGVPWQSGNRYNWPADGGG